MLPRRLGLFHPLRLPARVSAHLIASHPSTALIRLKSSSSSPSTQPPQTGNQQSVEKTSSSRSHALPAPGEGGGAGTISLDISGEGSTVRLDALGPLVVNHDGSMSRVANWAEMADIERETTLRVLGKRNKARLEALRQSERQSHDTDEGKEGGI